jgi:protein-S-isoprenylcysteine O-methyltransferase Ste14
MQKVLFYHTSYLIKLSVNKLSSQQNDKMNLKYKSLAAFGVVLIGAVYLYFKNYIFANNFISAVIQVGALALMIWARLTFGMRSFNATANATEGKLITNGPYHWLRHPIYASLIYFFVSVFISYPFLDTIIAVLLIIIGLFGRMLLEETSLMAIYDEYEDYCKKTKRVIPFVF